MAPCFTLHILYLAVRFKDDGPDTTRSEPDLGRQEDETPESQSIDEKMARLEQSHKRMKFRNR